MATQEYLKGLSGKELLERIRVQAMFKNPSPMPLFRSQGLKETGEALISQVAEPEESKYAEWQNFKSATKSAENEIHIMALATEIQRFKDDLQRLEKSYLMRSLIPRDQALEDLVLLGQELLRRKYMGLLLNPEETAVLSPAATLIIETGSAAIQILGRAPAGPRYSYRKFNRKDVPSADSLGIEILSSGAFPDWFDATLSELRKEEIINQMGFDDVIEASLDTPRSHVLAQMIRRGEDVSPLKFPVFQRMMLDLELMRLGQATTPGTYNMLLNSFYYGALFVDHSTNVSEQVQIIYEEENWKPAHKFDSSKSPEKNASEAAQKLLTEYFRFKTTSSIGRDHPREARIEFSAGSDPNDVRSFFQRLMQYLKSGNVDGKQLPRLAPVHKVIPAVRLDDKTDRLSSVKGIIEVVKSAGFKECYLIADSIHHVPGLLQYFSSAEETNGIIRHAESRGITLKDGRTVDMVATANKAIEAAAGAIESGQGCIKIGLLGLTYEQMQDFVHRVKKGLGATYKRHENQLLVFIGIVDRHIVSEEKVTTKASDVAALFVDLMRRTQHDILLIDTMDKGAEDPRLVVPLDKKDTKGGHLTVEQMRALVRKAHAGKCDLWVAGSYTEEQVYQTAMDDPDERPSLICLGGAERSFGGLRLNPSEAYTPQSRSEEEKRLAALVEYDADIKFLLSRENKLARDAGNVVGELRRRKKKEWKKLEDSRNNYLEKRNAFFNMLAAAAKGDGLSTKNIDTLFFDAEKTFKRAETKKSVVLAKDQFQKTRNAYVEQITRYMVELFQNEWFPSSKG